jgi:quercetin dioxygenase-like cupin family protein
VRGADTVEQTSNGLTYVPLSNAGRFFSIQPIKVTVPVSRTGNEHYQHEGEEWIYVLSGALTLSLAGRTYKLQRGDAAHFDSRLPHRLIARGSRDAEVLVVASPVSGSQPTPRPAAGERRAIPALSLLDSSPRATRPARSSSGQAKKVVSPPRQTS